ncbi:MAG: 3-phosphoshikimate 1-carboxyvinyltransferase [Actinobacteria bacterium]|nr:3-phosphoshikimate 1-carboxyvinyltransferase [Actinomycetota bacterium]
MKPFSGPVAASVRVPGSKSLTNRALMCAALAAGTSRIGGILLADDTEAMLSCISNLGADVRLDRANDSVEIRGFAGRPLDGPIDLDARLSGTTSRFVAASLVLGSGPYRLTGAPPLQGRPLGPTLDALVELGSQLSFEGDDGCLPVIVNNPAPKAGSTMPTISVSGDVSSQFLSGLLLVGPCLPNGLRIDVSTPLVSRPYVDMTLSVMVAFGAVVDEGGTGFIVSPGGYTGTDFTVEPDASAASYFYASAAICGGSMTVEGLGTDSIQGDVGFVDALEAMGCRIDRTPDSITVTGPALHGLDVDFSDISDTAQTLAAVAIFVDSPTRVTGIGFIRRKETDRIAAVVAELRRLGLEASEDPDGFTVVPSSPSPAEIHTYEDHRMAMSFALVGLRAPGIQIQDPACVAKTFPDYFERLELIRPGSEQ